MAWTAFGLPALLVLLMSDASIARPSDQPPATIAVRVFAVSAVSPGVLERAELEAHAIFRGIGVNAVWTNCAGAQLATCQSPINADEVVVRIVAARVAISQRVVPMGAALVVPGQRHGSLATIYVDAVDTTAAHAMADPSRLLGRAVAHEIGHLLLNTNEHSNNGLMRAVWSLSEMRRDNPLDWRFTDHEAAAITHSLQAWHDSAMAQASYAPLGGSR